MQISDFIKNNKMSMTVESVDHNPSLARDDDWAKTAHHYYVTVRFKKEKVELYYSMGAALTDEPMLDDVLNCLSMDAQSIQGRSFEEWCLDLGENADSRRAYTTYGLIQAQTNALKKMLGVERFTTLLEEVESL